MGHGSIYRCFWKRVLDFWISLVALIILCPVLLFTAMVLALFQNGQWLFTQIRPGLGGHPFRIFKFKTMNDLRDPIGNLLPDEQRLTRVGAVVRSLSVDELPQLINVLCGQMSLVGPRPLLMEYLPLYSLTQMRRHEVRPGLTGLAQVRGRNSICWEERFAYDIEYVDSVSFLLDLRVMLETVECIFRRRGISSGTSVTMEPFIGSQHE